MDTAASRTVNASDAGLIVQGVLILLSAIVAVLGYVVQNNLKKKERQREVRWERTRETNRFKLDHLRRKLGEFVGPAFQLALAINTQLSYMETYYEKEFPNEFKAYVKRCEEEGISKYGYYKGVWNKKWSMVPKEIEMKLLEDCDPTSSEPHKVYIMQIRALVKKWARPLANLIKTKGQHLQHWGTPESYKERFPVAANNGALRNLFPTQLLRWCCEMEELIEQRWDKGDFAQLSAVVNPYPMCITPHFAVMVSELREVENKYGIANHEVNAADSRKDHADQFEKGGKFAKPTKKSSYVSSKSNDK